MGTLASKYPPKIMIHTKITRSSGLFVLTWNFCDIAWNVGWCELICKKGKVQNDIVTYYRINKPLQLSTNEKHPMELCLKTIFQKNPVLCSPHFTISFFNVANHREKHSFKILCGLKCDGERCLRTQVWEKC